MPAKKKGLTRLLALAATLLCGPALAVRWTTYGFDLERSRFNPAEHRISRTSVGRLGGTLVLPDGCCGLCLPVGGARHRLRRLVERHDVRPRGVQRTDAMDVQHRRSASGRPLGFPGHPVIRGRLAREGVLRCRRRQRLRAQRPQRDGRMEGVPRRSRHGGRRRARVVVASGVRRHRVRGEGVAYRCTLRARRRVRARRGDRRSEVALQRSPGRGVRQRHAPAVRDRRGLPRQPMRPLPGLSRRGRAAAAVAALRLECRLHRARDLPESARRRGGVVPRGRYGAAGRVRGNRRLRTVRRDRLGERDHRPRCRLGRIALGFPPAPPPIYATSTSSPRPTSSGRGGVG